LGYRFPAEWEPHAATWISWPRPDGISFPDSYQRVAPTLVEMVEALVESETVCVNVGDARQEAEVAGYLSASARAKVRFARIATNEPWCRDHGPMFVTRDDEPRLAVLDWRYNAWGGKYPPYDLDDAVPARVAELLDLPVYRSELVLEGGAFDANGQGVLLTTESCLLNPNRNPNASREQIEQALKDYLGVRQVVWLGDGIAGDDTDGHVDDLARFVSANTIVAVVEENLRDANYSPLRDNLRRLQAIKLPDGARPRVLQLPMPAPIEREGQRLPASYANFYIANNIVLLPIFGDPNDAVAEKILQQVFPDRKIVAIDCRELIWGLGAFHCLTQQQPRA
jgi:agmatine deiminase